MTLNEEIENIKAWYAIWLVNKGLQKGLVSFTQYMIEAKLFDVYYDEAYGQISTEVLGV